MLYFNSSHKRPSLRQIQKVIGFTKIPLLSVAILVKQFLAIFYNSAIKIYAEYNSVQFKVGRFV